MSTISVAVSIHRFGVDTMSWAHSRSLIVVLIELMSRARRASLVAKEQRATSGGAWCVGVSPHSESDKTHRPGSSGIWEIVDRRWVAVMTEADAYNCHKKPRFSSGWLAARRRDCALVPPSGGQDGTPPWSEVGRSIYLKPQHYRPSPSRPQSDHR